MASFRVEALKLYKRPATWVLLIVALASPCSPAPSR